MAEKYYPTGNDYISIPTLNTCGEIERINFLHYASRGLFEIIGNPLFKIFFEIEGKFIGLSENNCSVERINHWIPRFNISLPGYPGLQAQATIITPQEERGFIYRIKISNKTGSEVKLKTGMLVNWTRVEHCINNSTEMLGNKNIGYSWTNILILKFVSPYPLFCIAVKPEIETNTESEKNPKTSLKENSAQMEYSINLAPKEEKYVNFMVGVGLEEMSAVCTAYNFGREKVDTLQNKTENWLEKHSITIKEKKLNEILNLNLFFNYFYSIGKTLDTEELVCITSRSSRYYVSCAYWDRDILLWSFPAILIMDELRAKSMLEYVFTKQIKTAGIHSKYINGTTLEPGLEIDELCAPVIALRKYAEKTGDMEFLRKEHIKEGLKLIEEKLLLQKHPEIDLYATFLTPSDDFEPYPYETFDNALVCRLFNDLAWLSVKSGNKTKAKQYTAKAKKVEKAIWKNCISQRNGKDIFLWSTDLKGNFRLYDEPPGSLELLPYYGFCSKDNKIYQETVKYLHSPDYKYSFSKSPFSFIGCDHNPHPWILSAANELLCGDKEKAKKILAKATMDNGIASEAIDENTGEAHGGEAFATCAGFLSYALYTATK